MIDREAVVRAESERFGAVLATTAPAARVPTCPGRDAVDLLQHPTRVHQFWAAVVGERLTGAAVQEFEQRRPALPDDPARLQLARRQATAALLAALRARNPSEAAWSWFPPDQSADFTWRMQTHETTMHRVDAELTAGLPISSIDAEVAGDGVDHVVDVMWAWAPPEAERRRTGTLLLRATDTGRSWLVQTSRWTGPAWGESPTDQIGCSRATGGQPDATVAGTAEDLDLLLWGRAHRDVTRAGEQEALEEFQHVLDHGIPQQHGTGTSVEVV